MGAGKIQAGFLKEEALGIGLEGCVAVGSGAERKEERGRERMVC